MMRRGRRELALNTNPSPPPYTCCGKIVGIELARKIKSILPTGGREKD